MATEQESTSRTSIQRNLHRPEDEIADRPQLRVKPLNREDAPQAAEEAPAEPDAAAAAAAAAEAEAEALAQAATIIVEPPDADAPETAAPEAAEPAEADQETAGEAPKKLSKLPRIDPNRDPSLYAATYGPAPADAAAEKAQLAAITGQKAKDREISAGFLLGIALIALVLIGGVVIVRLQKHVQRLENRVSLLEQGPTQTASAAPTR